LELAVAFWYYKIRSPRAIKYFLSRIDPSLAPEVQSAASQFGIRAILSTPLVYQQEYLGGIAYISAIASGNGLPMKYRWLKQLAISVRSPFTKLSCLAGATTSPTRTITKSD